MFQKNEEISPSSVCDLQTSMQGRRNRLADGGVCVCGDVGVGGS